jgi:hypothetical protein
MKTLTEAQIDQLSANTRTLGNPDQLLECRRYYLEFCRALEVPDEVHLTVMRGPIDVCEPPGAAHSDALTALPRKLRSRTTAAEEVQREIEHDLEQAKLDPDFAVYSYCLFMPPSRAPSFLPPGDFTAHRAYVIRYAKKVWKKQDMLPPPLPPPPPRRISRLADE